MESTGNPYQLAYDEAYAAIYPRVGKSFYIRLWFQVGVSCMAFLLSCLYLLLAFLNGKARNKKLYLIQIVKLPFGRLLVLNSLYLYSLLSAVSALIIGISQREQYLTNVKFQPGSSKAPWGLFVWLAPWLSAWVFVFPHLVATTRVREQASAVESATTTWIWAHNAICIGVAVIFYVVAIPVGYISASKNENVRIVGMQALEQLHQLAQQYDQDPGSITSASQARLAETQAELARLVDQVWPWTKARIGFATAFLGAFAVAAAASYTFVIYLQKATTIRRNTTRGFDGAGAAVHVVQEQVTSIEGPSSDAPASIELSKYKRAKTTKPAFSGPPEPAPANATFAGLMRPANLTAVQVRAMNEAALVRLAKDLQTAIPLFIATCLYFIIAGILVMVKLPSATAGSNWQAFLQDGFTIPYLTVTTPIHSALVYNMMSNYASPESHPSNSSSARIAAAGHFGAFKLSASNRRDTFDDETRNPAVSSQGTPIQLDLSVNGQHPYSSKVDLEARSEDKVYL